MNFSLTIDAKSKHDAIKQLESADGVPSAVKAFVGLAIDGFKEEGGNHAVSDDPEFSQKPKNPVSIKATASGVLDANGGTSSCQISVAKG